MTLYEKIHTEEKGQSMIEYGLLLAMVVLLVFTVFFAFQPLVTDLLFEPTEVLDDEEIEEELEERLNEEEGE